VRATLRLLLLLLVPALTAAAEPPEATESAEDFVYRAMLDAPDVDGQAWVLVELTWMSDDLDPEIAAKAREILVGFHKSGIPAVRRAIAEVDPEKQADTVRVLIEQMSRVPAGIPPDFWPSIEYALWYGTVETRRLAISQVVKYRFRTLLLPVIDCAYDYPALKPEVVDALGWIDNPRARYWLEEVLLEDPGNRDAAAASLARLGGDAVVPLKTALAAEDPAIRKAAIWPLLEIAGPNELTALHEYVYRFPDDDPKAVEAARSLAEEIEKAIEAYYATDGEQGG
jgi:hypothetical protein